MLSPWLDDKNSDDDDDDIVLDDPEVTLPLENIITFFSVLFLKITLQHWENVRVTEGGTLYNMNPI